MRARVFIIIIFFICAWGRADDAFSIDIGVYYYPGWRSDSANWNDLRGLPGSKSPGTAWYDREPLIGFYPEEEIWVTKQHIEWASEYGIKFFAYDWYWNGNKPYLEHALNSFIALEDKKGVQFCILWANHSIVPRSRKEYEDMIAYWIQNLFTQASYYKVGSKPVVFIFSYSELDQNAHKFGESIDTLIKIANTVAINAGLNGIYFVAVSNSRPEVFIEKKLLGRGFSAYTGWNYMASQDQQKSADYNSMVKTYIDFYKAAMETPGELPYLVTATPGWDSRPWEKDAFYRENPTPEKFTQMLKAAKNTIEKQENSPKILMIEAWNEFCEGSYIEPTKKWGMQYLEAIKKVFFKE